MDDTPYVNDGADASLRKTVSLLNKIEAKTGSATITGPVTVTNEVEVTNSSGSPIPVSGTVTANTGLTQPLTDAQLRATAVPVNENLIVNQGSLFLYSTTGTYGAFDCGADADYVVFNRAGGGGGFTQKLEFSTTSDFATVYDTLSGSFAIFSEKFITNTGDIHSQAPTNTSLASNDGGSYVVNLRRLTTYGGNENLKVRYVRVVVSGGGGGGFSGKFTSFRSKTSDAFNMNAAPHRTLISGTVDINSAKRPLPVTDNDGSLTVDGTVELGATSLSALENIQVTFPSTQNVSVQNSSLSVTGTVTANTGLTQPLTDTQLRATAVPVSGTVTANTGLTQPLTDTQLRATAVPISGTVTANTGLTPLTDTQLRATAVPVSGTFFQGTQPVSLASVPSHDVTGSGSFTAAQATAANLNATVVGSGSFTAAQATASNLKAQAQLLDSAGSLLTYAATGTAGTPGVDVVSIQGVSSGVAVTVSGPVTDTQLRASAISVSDKGSVGQATVTTFTSTSSLVLMASNSARKLLTVFNEGAGVLYLLYGAGTASITNYSVRINSGDYLEIEKYTGTVTGIFGTTGTARATEIS